MPSRKDQLETLPNLNWYTLIKEGDSLNNKGLKFGCNNDYLALLPHPKEPDHYLMAVNHESFNPLISFGNETFSREKSWLELEMASVGVSIIKIQKHENKFQFIFNAQENQRIDANTTIPFDSVRPIEGALTARGTFANCAGGVTPWGTYLSCEENFQDFVGDRPKGRVTIRYPSKTQFRWCESYDMPTEHYGWVVEVNPFTGESKKLTALGRMVHEGATVTKSKNGKAVVYMGDDDNDRCLFKFISHASDNLSKGTLYVANLEKRIWIPLDRSTNPKLKKAFADHTELLIYAREAAEIVDGSKLDRPEDIEIQPGTGHIFISLTNNKIKNRPHGSILKIIEKDNDPGAIEFESSTLILGGEESGFSSPDNLAFDRNGNLWMTTDVSGADIGTENYLFGGNNSLFFLPLHGAHSGKAYRVANAPIDSEFTGPCFSQDGSTLFLSVQHPGELSPSNKNYTSHWPNGINHKPQSAVIALSGSTLDYLTGSEFSPRT
jgi:secreted PhoX family phosphatase